MVFYRCFVPTGLSIASNYFQFSIPLMFHPSGFNGNRVGNLVRVNTSVIALFSFGTKRIFAMTDAFVIEYAMSINHSQQTIVIVRSAATKQSMRKRAFWIASLRSQTQVRRSQWRTPLWLSPQCQQTIVNKPSSLRGAQRRSNPWENEPFGLLRYARKRKFDGVNDGRLCDWVRNVNKPLSKICVWKTNRRFWGIFLGFCTFFDAEKLKNHNNSTNFRRAMKFFPKNNKLLFFDFESITQASIKNLCISTTFFRLD
jgi:hypothetical protein